MTFLLTNWLIVGFLVYFIYLIFRFWNRAIGTKKRNDQNFHDVPGWPLLGNLPGLIANRSRPLEWASLRALNYNPGNSITVPGLRLIDISKPEWIEYVQKTNFHNYVKGNLFQLVMEDVFGNGIFASDGENWKKTRSSTSAIFNVNSFKSIMAPSVHSSLVSLLRVMELGAEGHKCLDLCDLFFKFTLESFLKMSFGIDVDLIIGTLRSGKSAEVDCTALQCATNNFAKAFDFAQNQLDWRFSMLNGWKLFEKLNFPIRRKMKNACNVLDQYAYSLIDERLSARQNEKNLEEKSDLYKRDLLGMFMQARDDRGGGLNRTELKDAVLNLIVAGRDTTAQALSWSFYHLIMNPETMAKVREETREVLGGEKGEPVAYENYKQLTWTQAVVFETLRLHPSVPKNLKVALNHDTIPDGPVIEPGDCVRWSDWQMGRDPKIWGPDCGEFKPERWLAESGKLRQFGQFKFHAFNGGPRMCLGMNLAIFEVVAVIVEVLKRFDLQFYPDWLQKVAKSESLPGISTMYPTPHYGSSLTLPMKSAMKIEIKRRSL